MTVDTNILIAYLNGETKVQELLDDWKQSNRLLLISSISVAEVLALPNLNPQDVDSIREFLRQFVSVPLNNELAEATAFVQRKYRLKLPDAAIAATALSRRVPLVTRDTQFQKIKELVVVPI